MKPSHIIYPPTRNGQTEFGRLLDGWMARTGKTLKTVCDEVGCSDRTLRGARLGTHPVQHRTWVKLAAYLGYTPESLRELVYGDPNTELVTAERS